MKVILNDSDKNLLIKILAYYQLHYAILLKEDDPSEMRKYADKNHIDCGICRCIAQVFENPSVFLINDHDWIKKANPNIGSEYWYDTIVWGGMMTKDEILKCISVRIEIMENLLTQQI